MTIATRILKIENEAREIFRECKTKSELKECRDIIFETVERLCCIRNNELTQMKKDKVNVTRCHKCKNVIEQYSEVTGETFYFCSIHNYMGVNQFGYCDRGEDK